MCCDVANGALLASVLYCPQLHSLPANVLNLSSLQSLTDCNPHLAKKCRDGSCILRYDTCRMYSLHCTLVYLGSNTTELDAPRADTPAFTSWPLEVAAPSSLFVELCHTILMVD